MLIDGLIIRQPWLTWARFRVIYTFRSEYQLLMAILQEAINSLPQEQATVW